MGLALAYWKLVVGEHHMMLGVSAMMDMELRP
jgi:hypothetical protein